MEGTRTDSVAVVEDLTGELGGVPERFAPGRLSGELVEVEHFVRYWWAARLASGRTALDAGCGAGYGVRALAEGGAKRVVGVDIAQPVLDAIESEMPDGVELRRADVGELPFADDSFDMTTCFEVVEHVADPDRVLDELARVTAADGLVLVSSPNRDVTVPGNPHHVHEYVPGELRSALAARFASVALLRQHDVSASLIAPEDALRATGAAAFAAAPVAKLNELQIDREPYTVALASQGELPALEPFVCLTAPIEVRRWIARFADQQQLIDEQGKALDGLEDVVAQRRALADQLAEAEQETVRMADLEQALDELGDAYRELEQSYDKQSRELEGARAALDAIKRSPSWRLTTPLRDGKRIVKRRLRGE